MLVQVYRYGPSRQRIVKGYVVAGLAPQQTFEQLQRPVCDPSIRVRFDGRLPQAVWLDTGMVWLHTTAARESCLASLNDAVHAVANVIGRAGGVVMPSAVRSDQARPWHHFLCGDRHYLETLDDTEREVFCNLMREHTPLLIAASGRAGVEVEGVEPLGSRRLSESRQHFAAQYLASVAPEHLARVAQCLRREAGVSRLDVLDVNPLGDAEAENSNVELRFNDAQMLLSNVRAQAILYQALLLKARRLARKGSRVGYLDQRLLERNRARAVANELRASFEREPDRRQQGRRPAPENGQSTTNEMISGDSMLLELLEGLRLELQVLEVEYGEIAPLVLGSSLRQLGLAGLRTENDLFRATCKQASRDAKKLVDRIGGYFLTRHAHHTDPLSRWNEDHFPQAAQLIRRSWTLLLRHTPAETPRGNGRRREKSNADQPKRKAKSPPKGRANLASAAKTLVEALREFGRQPSPSQCAKCLASFLRVGASTELNSGLRTLPREEAQGVRKSLRPSGELQFKLRSTTGIWAEKQAQDALQALRQQSICLLSFIVGQDQEREAAERADRYRSESPEGVNTFLFTQYRFKSKKSGKSLVQIELLLSRAEEHPA